MINELVVHLGDTKTGSTSIQKALVAKAYDIPNKTLIYPTVNNHIGMAKTLTLKRRFAEREKRFKRVYEVLGKSDADYGVVSAEHFQFVDPVVFDEAIKTYWPKLRDRIRLVAYVRPHGSKILSAFAERVKLGNDVETIERFIQTSSDKRMFDYTERFSKWRDVFGDRFTLRPFIRDELYNRDAIQDFFHFLVGGPEFRITEEIAANSSLTVSQLALLRKMHVQLAKHKKDKKGAAKFKEGKGSVGRVMAEYMRDNPLGQDGEKVKLPSSKIDFIKERYAEDAKALDAAFFSGSPMFNDLQQIEKSATDKPQPLKAGKYFSKDVLQSVNIFSDVLGDIVVNAPTSTKKAISKSRSGTE